VNAARHFGFGFYERDQNNFMKVKMTREGDTEVKFELLAKIEFDSTRKRMSVIVRTPDNRIMLVCKGADSIIEALLKKGQKSLAATKKFLDEFARDGLRTLLVAYRYVDEDFFESWSKKYQDASKKLVGKEKAMEECAA